MRVISCFVLYFLFNVDAIAQIPDVQKLKDSIIKPQLNADTLLNKISLQDIVIKGKKPTVSFKLDRQVFRAAVFKWQ
jgi:acid phosphatase class B